MIAPDFVTAAMVAAAVAPALILLWLVVAADSRPEPPRVVLISVVLGALSAAAIATLGLWLHWQVPHGPNQWLAAGEAAFLMAAIPEEVLKVSIIANIALRARDFDEPMDGVVYGTAVGLGFAALENVLYVVGSDTQWIGVAITRAALSVPFHAALGAIAGAYIVRARFGGALGAHKGDRWRRPRLFLSAWLIPIVLHGLFDTSQFSMRDVPMYIADTAEGVLEKVLLLLIGCVIGFGTILFAARMARKIAQRQKAWLQTRRLPLTHLRDVWAECLVGVGLSFVALTLVIAGNSIIKIAGCVLLAFAVSMSWKCGRHLSEVAKNRRLSAVGVSS
jgi:RsiW-degrading membrane proteinase PrsW (M82 family)